MYATVADMIARFGETQMIRLSRPEDRTAETVDADVINRALDDATALIDGYVRGRYFAPIAVPPAEIIRAACILARYDLADGEHTTPTTEMTKARDDVTAWLKGVANETIHLNLPLAEPTGTDAVGTGPRISDRERLMTRENLW